MKDTGLVALTEFLRHPSMVGSAFPATARMVRHVLASIDWAQISVAIEFGPGSGRFTFAMLERMRPDATLLALETGAAFVEKLRAANRDPRLIVVKDSAIEVHRHLAAHELARPDLVLSGLPFSSLDECEAEAIMGVTAATLNSSGLFAAYQMRSTIRGLIYRHFAVVRHAYEWRNIPPCHLYWARKPGARENRGANARSHSVDEGSGLET